jgi:ABC-type Mn2+/Zn2+ transport system permease subunit
MPSPLDLADISFLREALFELVLLAAAGGLLSAWVVLRRLAFFSHAVGSATFPGLVVADATGFSPLLAGLAVAVIGSLTYALIAVLR